MESVCNVPISTRNLESRCNGLEILLKREMDDYQAKDDQLKASRLRLFVRRNDMNLRKRALNNRKSLANSLIKMNSSDQVSAEDQEDVVEALKQIRETISVVKSEIRRCRSQIGLYRSSSSFSTVRDSSSYNESVEQLSFVHSKAVTKEAALDRILKKLRVKIKQLQAKDERLIREQEVLRSKLSYPLDSVRVEEVLTEDTEAKLLSVHNWHSRIPPVSEDEIDLERIQVETIERRNQDKKRRIEELKTRISNLRSSITGAHFQIQKTQWHLSKIELQSMEITGAVASINQRISDAVKKQEFLAVKEREITELLNQFEKQKGYFQTIFEEQRKSIEILCVRIKETKELKDKIFDMEEEVSNLKQELLRWQLKKQQLQGEIQSISKAIQTLKSKQSDNSRLVYAFGLKEQAFVRKQDRISRRNDFLKTRKERLTKALVEMNLTEKKVTSLEEDVKLFEGKVQAKNAEVRQLTKVRDTLRS